MALPRWRKQARTRLARFGSQQLARAVFLGVIIGIVAGTGAILFVEGIDLAGKLLLEGIAGYRPPAPAGEGDPIGEGPTRLWALPLVLGLGGLLSGVIVAALAPEAEGHGTDAAIGAFHHKGGRTRFRAVPVKLVASAITIGSGGAAGREGPTAQIGGGFGSMVADRLGLGAVERRKALAAGMGAGIGSIFRAPLGGAMMGAEVLYKHDFEADVILMALISSIVGYAIFGSWTDYEPIFGGAGGFAFTEPQELPYYALLGVACGLIGLLYARSFYAVMGFFRRLDMPTWLKPAIGGVLVGLIGTQAPEAIHVGYGWVQQAFTEEGVMEFSPWLLVSLPFLRILTTSLTVGSGGSGGIFGPGMVIGGITGAVAWRFCNDLPGFPADPGPVVIIGMTAMFGAVAHAPLAMLLMVAEMTGNLSLLAPAMVAVAIATLVVGDTTIYESQVDTRADSPAHRDRFAFPLLTALPAHRAVAPLATIPSSSSVAEAIAALQEARQSFAVVLDNHGKVLGDIDLDALRAAANSDPLVPITPLSRPIPTFVLADTPLDQALDLLTNHERRWLPVLDGEDGPVLGAIDARALMRSYRRAAQSQMRPLSPVAEDVHSIEIVLPAESPLAGLSLTDAHLPPGVRILTVSRAGIIVVPHGGTLLAPGDRVTLTFPAAQRRTVFALLLGS